MIINKEYFVQLIYFQLTYYFKALSDHDVNVIFCDSSAR